MYNYKIFVSVIVGFNIFTVLLYLFPPVHRELTNDILVTVYLFVSIFFMYYGLKIGYRKGRLTNIPKKYIDKPVSPKIMNLLLMFHLLTFIIRYAYLLGFSPFDISGMITRIAVGIVDPGLGYHLHQNYHVTSPIPWSVFFIQSAVDSFFFIISFISWKRLKSAQKILIIIFVCIELLYWLGIGTNFGVITMITNFIFCILLSEKRYDNPKKERKTRRRNVTILTLLAAVAFIFFMNTIISRTGEGDHDTAMKNIEIKNTIDYDNFVVKFLPESIIPGYYYVYSYCCQGYENLGKAMNCEWKWTWFVGNNPHLQMLVQTLTGYNSFEDSYMRELEKKYQVDSYVSWHSAYVWWAGDVTIVGTILVVFIIALLCGYAYSFFYYHGDQISGIFAVVFANMLLFMFANNTYLSEIWYSFMFMFPYWFFTRLKRIQI